MMATLEKVRKRAESDARAYGYYLNSDSTLLEDLLEGLKLNEGRYGYPSCPCRLSSGTFEFDRDIICPCDYRDPDIEEFGYCYCALFVRKDLVESKTAFASIPERRPLEKQRRAYEPSEASDKKPSEPTAKTLEAKHGTRLRTWYCRQCGYMCFRENPPFVCPICRAKQEMFAEVAASVLSEKQRT